MANVSKEGQPDPTRKIAEIVEAAHQLPDEEVLDLLETSLIREGDTDGAQLVRQNREQYERNVLAGRLLVILDTANKAQDTSS